MLPINNNNSELLRALNDFYAEEHVFMAKLFAALQAGVRVALATFPSLYQCRKTFYKGLYDYYTGVRTATKELAKRRPTWDPYEEYEEVATESVDLANSWDLAAFNAATCIFEALPSQAEWDKVYRVFMCCLPGGWVQMFAMLVIKAPQQLPTFQCKDAVGFMDFCVQVSGGGRHVMCPEYMTWVLRDIPDNFLPLPRQALVQCSFSIAAEEYRKVLDSSDQQWVISVEWVHQIMAVKSVDTCLLLVNLANHLLRHLPDRVRMDPQIKEVTRLLKARYTLYLRKTKLPAAHDLVPLVLSFLMV